MNSLAPRSIRSAFLSGLLAGCAAVLSQCGTTSEPRLDRVLEVRQDDGYRVFHREATGTTYGVRMLPRGLDRKDVYSGQATEASLKVVNREGMQTLLDLFAKEGFFDRAGSAEVPGAKAVLIVEGGGRSWVWSRLPATQSEIPAIQAFQRAAQYLFVLHNTTDSFYTRENLTEDDFKRQNEALKERAQESIRNLQKNRRNQ